jgi:hypothetical protein
VHLFRSAASLSFIRTCYVRGGRAGHRVPPIGHREDEAEAWECEWPTESEVGKKDVTTGCRGSGKAGACQVQGTGVEVGRGSGDRTRADATTGASWTKMEKSRTERDGDMLINLHS